MNQNIINNFNQLIENLYLTKPTNYSFKVNSFKKTIKIIEELDFQISDVNQIKDIKGIGKGTLDRIEEIIKTGSLSIFTDLFLPTASPLIAIITISL